MLTALILLAAMDAAPALAAAQTPAPVSVAGTGMTRTLADVARERKLGIKPAGSGTLSVTGATGMPVLLRPAYEVPAPEMTLNGLPMSEVLAAGAGTYYPVYVGGGTRTVVVHEPTHVHASASHATPKRKQY